MHQVRHLRARVYLHNSVLGHTRLMASASGLYLSAVSRIARCVPDSSLHGQCSEVSLYRCCAHMQTGSALRIAGASGPIACMCSCGKGSLPVHGPNSIASFIPCPHADLFPDPPFPLQTHAEHSHIRSCAGSRILARKVFPTFIRRCIVLWPGVPHIYLALPPSAEPSWGASASHTSPARHLPRPHGFLLASFALAWPGSVRTYFPPPTPTGSPPPFRWVRDCSDHPSSKHSPANPSAGWDLHS